MAIADQAIGLEDHPLGTGLDDGLGGLRRRRTDRGFTGSDQRCGEQDSSGMRQRQTAKTDQGHEGHPTTSSNKHKLSSGDPGWIQGERSSPLGEDSGTDVLGAPARLTQRRAITAPLMRGSKSSASTTDSGSHSNAWNHSGGSLPYRSSTSTSGTTM